MPILTVKGAELAFGHVALLSAVDLVVEAGERIGLIGRNGSGKSSLLKAIAAQIKLDDGQIVRSSGLNLAYVPQEPLFDAGISVFDAVSSGVAHADTLATYLALSHQPSTPQNLASLAHLQEQLDATGSWAVAHRIDGVLSRLALNPDALVDTLSGGTRKRVALARALVSEPELLLLDEPTNHLDIESIGWLEELLVNYNGAVLVITHDRHFLDRVVTRIIELDRGILRSYPGSFASYQQRKADELSAEQGQNARFDKMLSQEEAWIRQGVEARRTRNEGRVRRLESLRRERSARRDRLGKVELALDAGERSGKLVAELIDVSKSWAGKPALSHVNLIVQRGDRLGIIGPNGTGKTTMLKLLLGELAPDSGEVRLGTNREVAYFDQLRARLDEEATLAQTIAPGGDWVEIGTQRTHVMTYLGRFLFAPERSRSPVRSLSGGERNRLLLAQLFARPANLLVLDEPTNDLDIETLELLEELLLEYSGTLLLVSHGRAFLDGVVTQTIAYEGDGRWQEYAGGYSDYEATRKKRLAASARAAKAAAAAGTAGGANLAGMVDNGSSELARGTSATPRPGSGATVSSGSGATATSRSGAAARSVSGATGRPPAAPPVPPARIKLTYKDQRELDGLPARITALEAEQAQLQAVLADPATYQRDGVALRQLTDRATAIEGQLLECLERWETLEARKT